MIHALFLIEDTSYRLDSRVRREVGTLKQAGVRCTVICPATDAEEPLHYVEDDVEVWQYRAERLAPGVAAHLAEYGLSLAWQTRLALKVHRRRPFDVVHVGNPPDLLWMVALPYRLRGRRFVFDQHDLSPELFEVRFAGRLPALRVLLQGMEQASYRLSHHVIAINQTCRDLALGRGGRRPEQVSIVRNGPRASDFPEGEADPRVAALGRVVVGYLGHMNPQDDLQVVLEVARELEERGRDDVGFVMVGSGTDWERLVALRDAWGLSERVYMPGRLPWDEVLACLRATHICVQPDLPGPFNDKVTMNKLMEYMALGKACVSFDLAETRVSGGDAVVYAPEATPQSMADQIEALADDPERREAMGRAARRRVDEELGWQHQARTLVGVYERLFPGQVRCPPELA